MYKVIIAGGRNFNNFELLDSEVSSILNSMINIPMDEFEIVSGLAPGADTLGKEFAKLNNFKLTEFPADWKKYGTAGGPIRNKEMAEYADMLIAFWDGKSKGTKNMIELAKKNNLKIHIISYA